MNEIRHTKSSLARNAFIQKSLSQSSSVEADYPNYVTVFERCAKDIKELKREICKMKKELERIDNEKETLCYNIPIKLNNLEKANSEEIEVQKNFLLNLTEELEKALADFHERKLKEQELVQRTEQLEKENAAVNKETEGYNYKVFKSGEMAKIFETDENNPLPCQKTDIKAILSEIRKAESELLKWQNVDCQFSKEDQSVRISKEDVDENLLSFIMDAVHHYLMHECSDTVKQCEMNNIISLFDFSSSEIEVIKSKQKNFK